MNGFALASRQTIARAAKFRWVRLNWCFNPWNFQNGKLFILSNPHNPTGNVWSEEELRTMGEICRRRGILVVSDEFHQDFILAPGKRHTPFASLGPEFAHASITCVSASKTFNLAGLQCANTIIPNQRLRPGSMPWWSTSLETIAISHKR